MNALTWTGRWWETTVVVLAANSVVFGEIGQARVQTRPGGGW